MASKLLQAFQFSIGVKSDTSGVDKTIEKIDELTNEIQELHNKRNSADAEEKKNIDEQISSLEEKRKVLQKHTQDLQKASNNIRTATNAIKQQLTSIKRVALGSFGVSGLVSGFFIGRQYDDIKDLNKDLLSIGTTGGKVFELLNASQSSTLTSLRDVSKEIQDIISSQREYKTFGTNDKTEFAMFGASISEDINTIISKFQNKIRGMSDTMGREFAKKMGLSEMYEVLKLSDEQIKKMRGADTLSMDSFNKMQRTMEELATLKNTLSSSRDRIVLSFSPLITTVLRNVNDFLNSNMVIGTLKGISAVIDGVTSIAKFVDPQGFKVFFSAMFGAGIIKVFKKLGITSLIKSLRTIGLKNILTSMLGVFNKILMASAVSFLIGAVVEDLFAWLSGSGAKSLFGEIFGEVSWGKGIVAILGTMLSLLTAYFASQKVKGLFSGIPIVGDLIGTLAGMAVGGAITAGGVAMTKVVSDKVSDHTNNANPGTTTTELQRIQESRQSSTYVNNSDLRTSNNSKNIVINVNGAKDPAFIGEEISKRIYKNERKNYYVNEFK